MKELKLQEIHEESLNILKDIHKFCTRHNIKYSIAYGTLLGAVRHKGFIPWDDDIDIIMTREEYTKFTKLYSSERYKLSCPENDQECWIPFARVYDDDKTLCKAGTTWYGGKQNRGLWIDVFALDNAPEPEEYKKIYNILFYLYNESTKVRRCNTPLTANMPIKMFKRILIKKLTHTKLTHTSPRKYIEGITYLNQKYNNDKTNHCAQLGCIDRQNGYFEKAKLSSYTLMPFEDTEVMAFTNYNYFLKTIYGDYMTPPEEKEIEKNSNKIRNIFRFYWK